VKAPLLKAAFVINVVTYVDSLEAQYTGPEDVFVTVHRCLIVSFSLPQPFSLEGRELRS